MNLEEAVKKFREQIFEIGREKGFREGIRFTCQTAMGQMILTQLEQKFKTVPVDYQRKLNKANLSLLMKISERILLSQSLEEVFGEKIILCTLCSKLEYSTVH